MCVYIYTHTHTFLFMWVCARMRVITPYISLLTSAKSRIFVFVMEAAAIVATGIEGTAAQIDKGSGSFENMELLRVSSGIHHEFWAILKPSCL